MSLKRAIPDVFRTIAFRLTIWYAGVFSISSCVAFGLFYYIAAQTLQDQTDRDKPSQRIVLDTELIIRDTVSFL